MKVKDCYPSIDEDQIYHKPEAHGFWQNVKERDIDDMTERQINWLDDLEESME